jgi:hypothetical protein
MRCSTRRSQPKIKEASLVNCLPAIFKRAYLRFNSHITRDASIFWSYLHVHDPLVSCIRAWRKHISTRKQHAKVRLVCHSVPELLAGAVDGLRIGSDSL